jgi:fructose-1,6-bisphosphatase/inositol monophosphatase family enzyme
MTLPPIDVLISAGYEAAKYILDFNNTSEKFVANRKSDGSWVLSLDLDCNQILRDKLVKFLPIVSEEEEETHNLIESQEPFFLIDPLDGTSVCRRFPLEKGGQIGFGPLLGSVVGGKVQQAVFVHVPRRSILVALRGKGCFAYNFNEDEKHINFASFKQIVPAFDSHKLNDLVGLFAVGDVWHFMPLVLLKEKGIIDNLYRFGGIANDAFRLVMGEEDFQFQHRVKAWDFASTLFLQEAGFKVFINPLGETVDYREWSLKKNNPILAAPPKLALSLLEELKKMPYSLSPRALY